MPKSDAVYAFLTDLKHQRQATRRLLELAEEQPEAVLEFLEALPAGWERIDSSYTELLLRLQTIAAEALRRKAAR